MGYGLLHSTPGFHTFQFHLCVANS
jgi:hypothetical protein